MEEGGAAVGAGDRGGDLLQLLKEAPHGLQGEGLSGLHCPVTGQGDGHPFFQGGAPLLAQYGFQIEPFGPRTFS